MLLVQRVRFYGQGDVQLNKDISYWLFFYAVGVGVTCDYVIYNDTGAYEKGTGQLNSAGLFSRSTVTAGSNGTAKAEFPALTHTILISKQVAAGSGLADGDYTDVTVSGGGTVMTLDLRLNEIIAPNGPVDFGAEQALQFRIENRTSDPPSPAVGQVWLRTDL